MINQTIQIMIIYGLIALVWSVVGYFIIKKDFESCGGADNGSFLESFYYVSLGLFIGFFWILTLPVITISFLIHKITITKE